MGPRDLNSAPYSPVHCSSHSMTSFQSSELTELPVVENSQLFAQRAYSARYAPLGRYAFAFADWRPGSIAYRQRCHRATTIARVVFYPMTAFQQGQVAWSKLRCGSVAASLVQTDVCKEIHPWVGTCCSVASRRSARTGIAMFGLVVLNKGCHLGFNNVFYFNPHV